MAEDKTLQEPYKAVLPLVGVTTAGEGRFFYAAKGLMKTKEEAEKLLDEMTDLFAKHCLTVNDLENTIDGLNVLIVKMKEHILNKTTVSSVINNWNHIEQAEKSVLPVPESCEN